MTTTSLNYDSGTDTNALTITLASLPTSATLVVGRQTTVVDNTGDLYTDVIINGQITTGTSPTVDTVVELWVYSSLKMVSGAETYHSDFGAADAGVTIASVQEKLALTRLHSFRVSATSNASYAIQNLSIAEACGQVPTFWGILVTHSTAVNLNATAGNHWLHYTGIKYTDA